MEKVSIIVPIYNAEQTLERCLDSIVNQTLDSVEIICINDGSTDNSLNILEKYARKYNIKVINQNNKGVSHARNEGLSIASGEYILFVDADDWIELNTCEILYNEAKNQNYDIIVFNYNIVTPSKTFIYKIKMESENKFILQGVFWNKLYKKDFLVQHKIKFPEGYITSEDFVFICLIYCYKPNATIINKAFYYYDNTQANSATKQWDTRLKTDMDSFYCFIQSPIFQAQDANLQLYLIDCWAKILFGSWSCIPDIILQKKYSNLLQEFLRNYKNFKYCDYKNLVGYFRVKHKYLILILKKLRDFFKSIFCK